jgi:hypothetical protein
MKASLILVGWSAHWPSSGSTAAASFHFFSARSAEVSSVSFSSGVTAGVAAAFFLRVLFVAGAAAGAVGEVQSPCAAHPLSCAMPLPSRDTLLPARAGPLLPSSQQLARKTLRVPRAALWTVPPRGRWPALFLCLLRRFRYFGSFGFGRLSTGLTFGFSSGAGDTRPAPSPGTVP